MKLKLHTAPTMLRSSAVRAAPEAVDREARQINGFAVITRGEALGHDHWVDTEMLDQVAEIGNATNVGLKSRFTHPGLSSDGLGKYLGRAVNFRRDGDLVRADLNLSDAASKSPDGDLADYLMTLAEDDPEAFGASIVFEQDYVAQRDFAEKHGAKPDEWGYLDMATFKSPDPLNEKNLLHWRVSGVSAVDAVDEPGANPGGFLHSTHELAANADMALSFVLGLRKSVPEGTFGGIAPDRVRSHFKSFLSRNDLCISKKENGMSPLRQCKLGEKLGGMLNELIDGQATEERPRDQIIQEMATEAGIEVEAVNEILSGAINCPPAENLEAFAKVLQSPAEDMFAAGNEDGCEYDAGGGEGAEPAGDSENSKGGKGRVRKASVNQLKATFPNEEKFVLSQVEKGATILEAKAAFAEVLQARNDVLKKENKRIKGAGPTGADPVSSGTPDEDLAPEGGEFMEVSRKYAGENKLSMRAAMSHIASTQPELHSKYIETQRDRAMEVFEKKKQLGIT